MVLNNGRAVLIAFLIVFALSGFGYSQAKPNDGTDIQRLDVVALTRLPLHSLPYYAP